MPVNFDINNERFADGRCRFYCLATSGQSPLRLPRFLPMLLFLSLTISCAGGDNATATSDHPALPPPALLIELVHGFQVAEDTTKKAGDIFRYLSSDSSSFYAGVYYTHQFRQNGVERCIVLTAVNNNYNFCHACRPTIGGSVMSFVDRHWKLDVVNPSVGKIGSWGKPPPDPEFVEIGDHAAGAMMRDTYMSQGITDGGLVLVGEIGKGFEILFEEYGLIKYNKGVCSEEPNESDYPHACYSYDASYELVGNPGGNVKDLVITVEGTVEDAETWVKPFSATQRYIFKGCYILEDKLASKPDGQVTIQAGAYQDYRSACRQLDIIRDLKLPAYLDYNLQKDDRQVYRVRINGFTDTEHARKAVQMLKDRKIAAFHFSR